jgi:hypothetical protein
LKDKEVKIRAHKPHVWHTDRSRLSLLDSQIRSA